MADFAAFPSGNTVLPALAQMSGTKEQSMQRNALPSALASATLTMVVALTNHASAMTIDPGLDVLSTTVTTQVERARGWCGAQRGCWGRPHYHPPQPYAYHSYRPWPYYNYFLGSGWPSYGWYR